MRINHNISALTALHQLEKSNNKLDKTLERLSSGLRINHAADDAAGLAITQKMDTQVRGLEQANRNAMDGISLIQTAEGALNEVHSMLQRIRELAVQVSNGTYDATDRKAVQDEVTELQNEIERISEDIEFNEMKLLNGDIDRRAFSTDADVADIVSMSDTVDAGDYTFDVEQSATKTSDMGGLVDLFDGDDEATVGGTININGEQVDIEVGESTEEVFSKLRDLCSTVDVSITIEPSSPFGNGKQLSLEVNDYGPEELNVTGDLQLLQSLGLDSEQFQPNTSNIYSTNVSVGAGLDIDLTGQSGSVLINGVTVSLDGGTDNSEQALYGKLEAANIEGIELSYDAAGNVQIYSNKPLVIEPANPSATGDSNLATALANLETGAAVEGYNDADLIKSIPSDSITTDGTAAAELTGQFAIYVDGASVATINASGAGAGDIGNIDLDDAADVETFITALNNAIPNDATTGNKHTTFSMTEDTPAKLVAYNLDGKEVTLMPLNTTTAADISSVAALGYTDSDVITESGFGNLGQNVQIDTSSLDGFPDGATVSTSGEDILFESNDNFELRLVAGGSTGSVTMNLLSTGPLDLQIGANEGQFMEIRIQNLSPRALGITDINLSTADGAQEAITTIDDAITTISDVRSKLGAYQNRLEHTVANLDTASENMTASLSRILDADMAYEMSQFTQQNIIQQAGTSMLAQANQRPQSLLQLLQG